MNSISPAAVTEAKRRFNFERIRYESAEGGGVRAILACPVTGEDREIASISLIDGGVITFPRDFSSLGDAEQFEQALPRKA